MRLSSIWLVVAAVYACTWLILIILSSEFYLIFMVHAFLFGCVGIVFAGVCRWVLERRLQSTGIRILTYACFLCYLVLIALYAWFTVFFGRSSDVALANYDLSSNITNAFVLFGMVFCAVAVSVGLYSMPKSNDP
jgi:hypothetical protein